MTDLRFHLSQIGFALKCNVIYTSRLKIFPNDIYSLKDGDSIFISPRESTINYDELLGFLKDNDIKVFFYIMDEPIVNNVLVDKLLPYAKHMFLQNNLYDHPQVHNMPIGIRDCEKVVPMCRGFSHDYLYDEGLKKVMKEILCLLCFSFTHDDRYDCYNTLKNKKFVLNINDNKYDEKNINIHCGKVPISINYEFTHKSIYVLSPRGVGEATHRFFEIIYLDSIPIVKRTNTSFDKLYDVFPCLIVNRWDEVTEELLNNNKDTCLDKLKRFKKDYPNAFTNLDSINNLLLLT